jgi:putative transposase
MPPFLERRQQTGDLHFLTFSCRDRLPFLQSAHAASIFEHSLEAMRQKYRFHVFGYVIMPEHVHLLLSEPPTHPLSTVIGSLKRSVSKQCPQSPFWLPRYYDRNIYSSDERVEKLRYIHRNPVTRGLVVEAKDYAWSSFNAHWTRVQGVITIAIDWPNDLPVPRT